MLERTAGQHDTASAPRLTITEARAGAWAADADMATMLGWIEGYLMRPHAELGREGAVCPFTKQSARIDAVRAAISRAGANDQPEVAKLMRTAFDELDAIPCKAGMEHFRTIIIGFPECMDDAAVEMLKRVQAEMKWVSLSRYRMIGLMFAKSDAPGLWNPNFRPQRSPMPILAIRHMVENDAFFAARHPLLCVPYLAKYKFKGVKRLWAAWKAKT